MRIEEEQLRGDVILRGVFEEAWAGGEVEAGDVEGCAVLGGGRPLRGGRGGAVGFQGGCCCCCRGRVGAIGGCGGVCCWRGGRRGGWGVVGGFLLGGEEVAAEGVGELEVGAVCAGLADDGGTALDDVTARGGIQVSMAVLRRWWYLWLWLHNQVQTGTTCAIRRGWRGCSHRGEVRGTWIDWMRNLPRRDD